MKKHWYLVWLLALPLMAWAGTVERMQKLEEKGELEKAIELGEEWLQSHKSDEEAPAVEAALEELWFQRAQGQNTVEGWKAFLVRFPKGTLAKKAKFQEAALAWKETEQSSLGAVRAYRERYVQGPVDVEAAKIEQELAWAETLKTDTVVAYQHFCQLYPEDSHIAEARQKETAAAYRETKKTNTPAALYSFITSYPSSTEAAEVRSTLLQQSARLTGACIQTCAEVPAGNPIGVGWSTIPGAKIQASLAASDGSSLTGAVEQWAGSRKTEAQSLLNSFVGAGDSTSWGWKLPFPLRRFTAEQPGYAVVLSGEGLAKPVVLPFTVESVYPATAAAAGVLSIRPDSVTFLLPGQPAQRIASFAQWAPKGIEKWEVVGTMVYLLPKEAPGLIVVDLQSKTSSRLFAEVYLGEFYVYGASVYGKAKDPSPARLFLVQEPGKALRELAVPSAQFWIQARAAEKPVFLIKANNSFAILDDTQQKSWSLKLSDFENPPQGGQGDAWLSPDGTKTAVCMPGQTVGLAIYETASGKVLNGYQLKGHSAFACRGAWSSSGIELSLDDTEVHIEDLLINPTNGQLRSPQKPLYAPPAGVSLEVRKVGNSYELFAVTAGNAIQLTKSSSFAFTAEPELPSLYPAASNVRWQVLPGGKWVQVLLAKAMYVIDGELVGPIVLVDFSGKTSIVLEMISFGLLDWPMQNWSPDGQYLLFPDGRIMGQDGKFLAVERGSVGNEWLLPPLGWLLQ